VVIYFIPFSYVLLNQIILNNVCRENQISKEYGEANLAPPSIPSPIRKKLLIGLKSCETKFCCLLICMYEMVSWSLWTNQCKNISCASSLFWKARTFWKDRKLMDTNSQCWFPHSNVQWHLTTCVTFAYWYIKCD